MATKDSIFEIKKSKRPDKSMSLKVPAELHDDIEQIKAKLESINPDMRFNVNAICIEALHKAIRAANKELKTLDGRASHG